MTKLVFIGEEFDGRVCELPEGTTRVGRGDDNQIIIRDPTVSVHHCQILVNGWEVIVREAGSRNGTWVHGVAVTGQMPVKSGMWIRFGAVVARLELDRPPLSEPETPETAVRELEEILAEQRRTARNPKPVAPAFTLERRSGAGTIEHTRLATPVVPEALPDPVPPAVPAGATAGSGAAPRRGWRRWLAGLFLLVLAFAPL